MLLNVSRSPSELRPLSAGRLISTVFWALRAWKMFHFGEGVEGAHTTTTNEPHPAGNSCMTLVLRYFCRLRNARALVSGLGASSERH